MNRIYELLLNGPLLIGEVRGFKAEVAKRFDKSDKTAPPIVFGVLKITLEQLGDGAPVMLAAYLPGGAEAEACSTALGLKRGAVIAVLVGRSELRNGIRKVNCTTDAMWMLTEDEIALLRP